MPITTEVIVERTQLPELIARLPELANQAVREQGQVCVADAKTNIVKYNAIDTGTMLGSVATHMLGEYEAEVSVNATSADGYPYPLVVNYGSSRVGPRPFFTEMIAKATREYPERIQRAMSRFR